MRCERLSAGDPQPLARELRALTPGPESVAELEFVEWTPDGQPRPARFVRMRDRSKARDVTRTG